MLKLANVTETDVVYDLGCGDGRILVTAVKLFHAQHAIGYELDTHRYRTALQTIRQQGLQDKVTIVQGDLFEADLSKATVIILFLTVMGNVRLRPKLEREVPWGTRIVSRRFDIDGWSPTQIQRVEDDILYLYRVPEAFLKLFGLDLQPEDPP
jgi:tRNA A58 N-methylase Trm61